MKKFFTKKTIRFVSAILIAATVLISCSTIILSSKITYDRYYEAAVKEKEYRKYLNSLPLELKSITANLVEGKEYFADGLASPKKSDLEVRAQFTEKGEDFEKILNDEDFKMAVPEDFSLKGGKIGVEYSFTPEKETEDAAEPVTTVKTAEVDVKLTEVMLESITVSDLPYRTYYSDAMKFLVDGMSVVATYNNGGKAVIPAEKLVSANKNILRTSDKEVEVSYTLNGVTKTTSVPVTVVKEADYKDGSILSIAVDGELSVENGKVLSSVRTPVRATYENGNRLLLGDDAYTVTGNLKYADFSKNCLLTFSLVSDKSVSCKTVATVVSTVKAADLTVVGGERKDFDGVKAITDFSSDAKLSFNLTATGLAKGELNVRIKNTGDGKTNLGSSLSLEVNGEKLKVSRLLSTVENDEFIDYAIGFPVLFAGENAISLSVSGNAKIAVSEVAFKTRYGGSFYSTIDEYLAKNSTPDLDVGSLAAWTGSGKSYMHGLCSDGEYLYGVCTSYEGGGNARKLLVKKISLSDGTTVASSSETERFSSESFAGVAYVDGKIIVFATNGKKYCTDSATLKTGWTEYTGFDIGDYKDVKMSDAAYIPAKKTYVFRISEASDNFTITSDRVDVVSASGEVKSTFSLKSVANYALTRVYASDEYIYASYKKDKVYQPYIVVYDYDGNVVNEFSVTYDFTPYSQDTIGYNVQGVAVVGDMIYFGLIRWEKSAAHMVLKAEYPELTDELDVSFTLGEYAKACASKNIEANATATLATPDKSTLSKAIGFSMGGVSDGDNMYLVVNDGNNVNATVFKVDPETWEVKANTIAEVTSSVKKQSSSKVFIKDSVVYLIPSHNMPGMLYGVETDKFVGYNVTMDEYALPFEGLDYITDATYSSAVERYAVLVNNLYTKNSGEQAKNTLYLFDKDGKKTGSEIPVSYKGWFAPSVTSDDKYVYVSYISDGQTVTPVDVFDWDGNKITTVSVTGVKFADNTAKKHNTTGIFTHNGNMYASLCDWRNGYFTYYLYKITVEVFPLG